MASGRLKLTFLQTLAVVFVVVESQMLVDNGIYTRVTVQIQPQKQPDNCVEFLDRLEVGPKSFLQHILTISTPGKDNFIL